MKRFFLWIGLKKDWRNDAAEAAAKAEEMMRKSQQRIQEDKATFRFFRRERVTNHLAERASAAFRGE